MIEVLHGTKETVVYKDIEGFKVHDNTDYEAYPNHWHTPIEIIMPVENYFDVFAKGKLFTLQEGDLLLVNSGVVHGMPSAIHGERFIFQVDISLLHNVADIDSTLSTIPQALLLTPETAPAIHEQLKTLMLEVCREYFSDSILISASIYSKLIEMLVLIGREYTGKRVADTAASKQKEHTEKFINVCNYIHEHCTEDLSLDAVAGYAGFSKFHFSRLFKNYTGFSFYKYLNKKRIEHAEKLLVDPSLSITEVALQSGFSSLSAFIRMFKLLKDCTPTEFRNLYES
ncbi:MAG: AraC family transcriptional regulator [bacterium]|nr:AraC family transcriptional regulator [bacterium]MCM1424503.1 AraC family transcriptional regulator [bacterium]